ncbi:uncharacterized protein MKK02DRAFT_33734 [Dioszegia hungarica]|uniref:F-box domain-containing protein n=1 Tax=Dioszegia hungarica TaxID=4972 RepID=A0AA38HA01_9TREE|nr:uncharacterized protein MKK02DRAFT_33734 [Dioszegia hungarica]KAI9636573.1 hypothetical protein MKK02DRAFT_33734 [Dioszegia hungarica]
MSSETPTAQPPRPSDRLSLLPLELRQQVIGCLDRCSALTLARVARRFTAPARDQLWRHLDLSIASKTKQYGDASSPPAGQPIRQSDQASSSSSRTTKNFANGLRPEQAKLDRERQRKEREEMPCIGDAIRQAGHRELSMVETIRAVDGLGTIYALLEPLLPWVPNLKRLSLDAKTSGEDRYCDSRLGRVEGKRVPTRPSHAQAQETDPLPLSRAIEIGQGTIEHLEFVALLMESAPTLATLDITFDMGTADRSHTSDSPFLITGVPNSLRSIRISSTYFGMTLARHLSPLLKNSLSLRQLMIVTPASLVDTTPLDNVLDCIQDLNCLQDIQIPGIPTLNALYRSDEDCRDHLRFRSFPMVRVLVLKPSCSDIMFKLWPESSNPEILSLDSSAHEALHYASHIINHKVSSSSASNTSTLPHCIRSELALQIRGTPRLRSIQLAKDDPIVLGPELFNQLRTFQARDECTFRIRSYKHAGQELLHIRLRTQWHQLSDVAVTDHPNIRATTWRTLRYRQKADQAPRAAPGVYARQPDGFRRCGSTDGGDGSDERDGGRQRGGVGQQGSGSRRGDLGSIDEVGADKGGQGEEWRSGAERLGSIVASRWLT